MQQNRRRAILVIAGVTAALLVGAVVTSGAWIGLRALPVRDRLTQVGELLRQFEHQLQERDVTSARSTLNTLKSEASAAHQRTLGLDWQIAAHVPGYGTDVAAVRTLAAVLDDLTQHALSVVLDLAGSLKPGDLVPTKGILALSRLQRLAPALTGVDTAVARAHDQVSAIRTEGLLDPLRQAVTEFGNGL